MEPLYRIKSMTDTLEVYEDKIRIGRTVLQAGPGRPVGSKTLAISDITQVRILDGMGRRILCFETVSEKQGAQLENQVTFGLRYFHTADMIKRYIEGKRKG